MKASTIQAPSLSASGSTLARADTAVLNLVINLFSLAVPVVLLQVFDRILPNQASGSAALLFIGAGVALVLESLLRFYRSYLLSQQAARYEYATSIAAVRKLFRCNIAKALTLGSGGLKQRLGDIASLREYYSGEAYTVLFDIPFGALFIGAIFYIGGPVGFIPLGVMAVSLAVAWILGRRLKSSFRDTSDIEDNRINYMSNIFKNIISIKGHAVERTILRKFRQETRNYIDQRTELDLLSQSMSHVISLLGYLTTIATVAVGGYLVMHGRLTTGGLAACTILSGRSLGPISALMLFWTQLQRSQVAKDRLGEFWGLEEDATFAQPGTNPGRPENGEIRFAGVEVPSFRGDPIRFDLTIPAGSHLLIDESQGRFLPPLIGMLIGTSPPKTGDLLIGGAPARGFERNVYRAAVGFVSRRAPLFRGTVMDNLTLYRPLLEDQAVDLSESLGLTRFVHSMPNGFRTNVGDMIGGPLEAGAIQRIAIIRAILNDPAVLLLNEADEGLDLAGRSRLSSLLPTLTDITILLSPSDSAMNSAFPSCLRLTPEGVAIHRHGCTPGGEQ